MKPLFSLMAAIVLTTMAAFSQQQNYGKTWVHGRQRPYVTDATVTPLSAVLWDTIINTPQIWLRANASNICNAAGDPIIVTNGYRIWDGNHNIMDNGDSIAPNIHFTQDGSSNQLQKTIILPVGDSIYYVFATNPSDSVRTGLKVLPKGGMDLLQYAEVDMTANNYAGKVISKKNIIWKDSSLSVSEMTAVRHGNGKDWWLVKRGIHRSDDSSIFYVYRVKKDSIIGPNIQTMRAQNSFGTWMGQSAFSNKGDRFVSVNLSDTLFMAEFDRCTGLFSNIQQIKVNPVTSTSPTFTITDSVVGGLAFSANDSFLYASLAYGIVQYDLHDANMIANRQVVAGFDTLPPNARKYLGLYLAPNGKIYTGSDNPQASSWSVIENPNLYGSASSFCGRCQQFPRWFSGFGPTGDSVFATLPSAPPNMPNYALTALPDACGNGLGIGVEQLLSSGTCCVYPNPVSDQLYLAYRFDEQVMQASLELRDIMGRMVRMESLPKDAGNYSINVSGLPEGIYHYRVVADGKPITEGKLLKQN